MKNTKTELNKLLALQETYPGLGWIPNADKDGWVFNEGVKAVYDSRTKENPAKLTGSELKLRELQLADPEGVAADNTLAAYARLAKEKRA